MSAVTRKLSHIEHAQAQQAHVTTPFKAIRLRHCALPEVDLNAVDLSANCLNHVLSAPLFISSMTGGPHLASRINQHLAEAARELGLAMGVGSQRIALESDDHAGLTHSVRTAIGDQPLFANLGAITASQLADIRCIERILAPLDADALILHFNPMQEALQDHGDRNWNGVLKACEAICRWSPIPVIAKEVGFGFDHQSAKALLDVGIQIIDVAGTGGTQFAAIEQTLAQQSATQELGDLFSDWGYSTPECLIELKQLDPITLWASGGIQSGLDVAKSLALGATLCGLGGRLLGPALESTDAVVAALQQIMYELKLSCFGVGVARSDALEYTHIWSTGSLKNLKYSASSIPD